MALRFDQWPSLPVRHKRFVASMAVRIDAVETMTSKLKSAFGADIRYRDVLLGLACKLSIFGVVIPGDPNRPAVDCQCAQADQTRRRHTGRAMGSA